MPGPARVANLRRVAALAYLGLPLTGLIAFFFSHRSRVRFHGLQAIVIGLTWGLLLQGAAMISSAITIAVAIAGFLVWAFFLVATAAGRDPRLPLLGDLTERLVEVDD